MKHDLCGLQLGEKEARWFNDATFLTTTLDLKRLRLTSLSGLIYHQLATQDLWSWYCLSLVIVYFLDTLLTLRT